MKNDTGGYIALSKQLLPRSEYSDQVVLPNNIVKSGENITIDGLLGNGTSDKIYGENDIVADEMFNNTAVYTGGGWKAIKHEPPMGDGKWQLYNIVDDPGENLNVANQHPDILQKLISAYGAYSKDVGVVIPRGQTYYLALQSASPPLNNQSKVTITSSDISPAHFSNPPDAGTPNIGN
jgi:hypothetical protein